MYLGGAWEWAQVGPGNEPRWDLGMYLGGAWEWAQVEPGMSPSQTSTKTSVCCFTPIYLDSQDLLQPTVSRSTLQSHHSDQGRQKR